jgi:hypothetical protein
LSRRALCPLLKVVLEAKNRPPKKNEKIVVHVFSYCFACFIYFFKNYNITNIFHFGLPQCILLLVRSQIASDLCKAE